MHKGAVKPAQDCSHPQPVKGTAAACQACDECLESAKDEVSDDDIANSVHLAAAHVKAAAGKEKKPRVRPSGKLKGWGQLFEICTSSDSNLGVAASEYDNILVFRVTKTHDFGNKAVVSELKIQIKSRPGCSIHGSLPCTVWCTWQQMCIHRYGPEYKAALDVRRLASIEMLKSFIECCEIALSQGGEVSFEWPKNCLGWLLPELIDFITRNGLYSVLVDGCATGMTDKDGVPMLKQWRFVTSSHRQAAALEKLRCPHDKEFIHSAIEGAKTKGTESYTLPLCRTLLSSVFGCHEHAPTFACGKVKESLVHRETDVPVGDFGLSPNHMPAYPDIWDESSSSGVPVSFCPGSEATSESFPVTAAVTKLLDRKEMHSDPKAIAAVKAEAQGLLHEETWLPSTVIEKSDLIAWARKNMKKIHIGDLLLLCSIKFFEMPEAYHKHKGRICFRGDNAKDQFGASAIYQDLSAAPTSIHSANCNLAYGCVPGHKTTQADAVRAYVQALLSSLYETYVRIPRELWPEKWVKEGWKAPCCKLNKALYGHPEAGAHWEAHLHKAIIACGGVSVPNHPSCYWMKSLKLLLNVYVDDLLLSGPEQHHAVFWTNLQAQGITIDEPEDLDRFLGRTHVQL